MLSGLNAKLHHALDDLKKLVPITPKQIGIDLNTIAFTIYPQTSVNADLILGKVNFIDSTQVIHSVSLPIAKNSSLYRLGCTLNFSRYFHESKKTHHRTPRFRILIINADGIPQLGFNIGPEEILRDNDRVDKESYNAFYRTDNADVRTAIVNEALQIIKSSVSKAITGDHLNSDFNCPFKLRPKLETDTRNIAFFIRETARIEHLFNLIRPFTLQSTVGPLYIEQLCINEKFVLRECRGEIIKNMPRRFYFITDLEPQVNTLKNVVFNEEGRITDEGKISNPVSEFVQACIDGVRESIDSSLFKVERFGSLAQDPYSPTRLSLSQSPRSTITIDLVSGSSHKNPSSVPAEIQESSNSSSFLPDPYIILPSRSLDTPFHTEVYSALTALTFLLPALTAGVDLSLRDAGYSHSYYGREIAKDRKSLWQRIQVTQCVPQNSPNSSPILRVRFEPIENSAVKPDPDLHEQWIDQNSLTTHPSDPSLKGIRKFVSQFYTKLHEQRILQKLHHELQPIITELFDIIRSQNLVQNAFDIIPLLDPAEPSEGKKLPQFDSKLFTLTKTIDLDSLILLKMCRMATLFFQIFSNAAVQDRTKKEGTCTHLFFPSGTESDEQVLLTEYSSTKLKNPIFGLQMPYVSNYKILFSQDGVYQVTTEHHLGYQLREPMKPAQTFFTCMYGRVTYPFAPSKEKTV